MSNYMSEYEEYYKNINKKNNDNQKSRYLPLHQKNSRSIYSIGRSNEQVQYFSKEYWVRRIIRELSCALVILTIFICLKYIKNDYVQKAYIWSKGIITSSFNYDEMIEAFNNYEFGTFRIKELNIGGFTVEDLKSDKINRRISNTINYLKSLINTQRV